MTKPLRGEIWQVNFNPSRGDEMQKKRPAIVISSDSLGSLAIKIVAPITQWSHRFGGKVWHVKVKPSSSNGLTKLSSVDTLQIRAVSMERFDSKIGVLESGLLEKVIAGVVAVIEYE